MKKEKFSGYRVAIASFILLFINLGLLGSTGVFIPPMAESLGVDSAELGLMVTFATGGAFIFSLLTNKFIEKIGAKATLVLALFLNAAYFGILAFANSLWMVYLGSFISGIVLALGTNVTLASILSNWFVEKRASVIGLVFGGGGFGSAFALFVAGQLISAVDWRMTYGVMGIALLIIGLPVAIFFITEKPETVGQKALGWEKIAQTDDVSEKEVDIPGIPFQKARKTYTYWAWMIGILLTSMVITSIITYVPSYWQSYGMDPVRAATFVSMVSLIGAVSSLVSGIIADKFGIHVYLTYTMLGYIVGATLLVLFPAPSIFVQFLSVFFIAVGYPCNANYPATIATAGFGRKDYTRINANLQTMLYFSKAILPIKVLGLGMIGLGLRANYTIQIFFAIAGFILLLTGYLKSPMREKKGIAVES